MAPPQPLHWRETAINDLTRIGRRVAAASPASADKLLDLIVAKVALLTMHPKLGHAGIKTGTASWWSTLTISSFVAFCRTAYMCCGLNIRQENRRPERAARPHGRWGWPVLSSCVAGRVKKLTYLVLSCCVKPQIKIH